jgi:hypothetical protein
MADVQSLVQPLYHAVFMYYAEALIPPTPDFDEFLRFVCGRQDFPPPTENPSRGDKHMPTKSRNRLKEPHAQDPRKLKSGRWQARVTFYDRHR